MINQITPKHDILKKKSVETTKLKDNAESSRTVYIVTIVFLIILIAVIVLLGIFIYLAINNFQKMIADEFYSNKEQSEKFMNKNFGEVKENLVKIEESIDAMQLTPA